MSRCGDGVAGDAAALARGCPRLRILELAGCAAVTGSLDGGGRLQRLEALDLEGCEGVAVPGLAQPLTAQSGGAERQVL